MNTRNFSYGYISDLVGDDIVAYKELIEILESSTVIPFALCRNILGEDYKNKVEHLNKILEGTGYYILTQSEEEYYYFSYKSRKDILGSDKDIQKQITILQEIVCEILLKNYPGILGRRRRHFEAIDFHSYSIGTNKFSATEFKERVGLMIRKVLKYDTEVGTPKMYGTGKQDISDTADKGLIQETGNMFCGELFQIPENDLENILAHDSRFNIKKYTFRGIEITKDEFIMCALGFTENGFQYGDFNLSTEEVLSVKSSLFSKIDKKGVKFSFEHDIKNKCIRFGQKLNNGPKNIHFLRYLQENPGRIISKDELKRVLECATDQSLICVRNKVPDEGANKKIIQVGCGKGLEGYYYGDQKGYDELQRKTLVTPAATTEAPKKKPEIPIDASAKNAKLAIVSQGETHTTSQGASINRPAVLTPNISRDITLKNNFSSEEISDICKGNADIDIDISTFSINGIVLNESCFSLVLFILAFRGDVISFTDIISHFNLQGEVENYPNGVVDINSGIHTLIARINAQLSNTGIFIQKNASGVYICPSEIPDIKEAQVGTSTFKYSEDHKVIFIDGKIIPLFSTEKIFLLLVNLLKKSPKFKIKDKYISDQKRSIIASINTILSDFGFRISTSPKGTMLQYLSGNEIEVKPRIMRKVFGGKHSVQHYMNDNCIIIGNKRIKLSNNDYDQHIIRLLRSTKETIKLGLGKLGKHPEGIINPINDYYKSKDLPFRVNNTFEISCTLK